MRQFMSGTNSNAAAALCCALLLAACAEQSHVNSPISEQIWRELEGSSAGPVHFDRLAGPDWTRVCFFGPYNEASAEVLGFDWNVGEKTDVLHSDGHTVIVFATDTSVSDYTIHRRDFGDFSGLSGECVPRQEAVLSGKDLGLVLACRL